MDMTGRLTAPKKTGVTPAKAQWLSGEGGGAWFYIQSEKSNFRIQRFTPQGIMDCDRVFQLTEAASAFDTEQEFEVNHISHCAKVKVTQFQKKFVFEFIQE